MLNITSLTGLFCFIDDFCKMFAKENSHKCLPINKRQRKCGLSLSEIMTIEVAFHYSDYKNFKAYYRECVLQDWKKEFPKTPCYSRFVQMKPLMLLPLGILMQCMSGQETGLYYVDSSAQAVCHIKRERSHKVFKGIAQKSKTTTGWFFGFKLHIIINHIGEIMSFKITQARTDDRKPVMDLIKQFKGFLFGDKGYISADLFDRLKEKAVTLVTKTKKNMKKKILDPFCKFFLKQRGIIESAFNLLKNACMIEHTRHRSPVNAFTNIVAGLVAYQFRSRKPRVKMAGLPVKMGLLN